MNNELSYKENSNQDIHILRYKGFDTSLARMFRLGGQRKKRAEKVSGILEHLNLAGIGGLKKIPATNHGESRIKHCVKYDLGDGYRIITAQMNKIVWFLFVGDHDECDRWLTKNTGMELGYSQSQKTWEPYYRTNSNEIVTITRPAKPSDGMVLDRLRSDLHQEFLEEVPPMVAIKISRLTGAPSMAEIQAICEDISDKERRLLVQDVLVFLSSDDRETAEKRLDEFSGRSVIAEDRPDAEILSVRDGDTVRRLVIGSDEYEDWLRGFAQDGDYLEWLLFMHPEQQRVVEEDFNGAAQLSGVSGSGKTCIAVRRAVRLAGERDDASVLLVTLNRSLAGLILRLVDAAAPDENIRDRITVTSFFELCQQLLKKFEPGREKYYDSVSWKLKEHVDEVFREYYRCWTKYHKAEVLRPVHASLTAQGINSEVYLKEEFDWLRTAINTADRHRYVSASDVPRLGRRHPLQESWRKLILEGLEGWEEKMEAIGVIDYLGLTTAVQCHVERLIPEYTNVIVDEAQDFGTTELSVIRKLVSEGKNDLFLCGDIAQHVLPKHRVLTQAGISIGNRYRRIDRNYRNTRQILEAAYDVLFQNLHEEMFDRAEKDLEILDPKFANRSSNEPLVLKAESLQEEFAYARSLIDSHLKLYPHAKCCIAIAGFSLCEVERFGTRLGIGTLDGTQEPFSNPVVLSDLEQTKGYEFDMVVVVNCREGVLPPFDAPPDEMYRHGCRLYVAMTRAKNDLYISYSGTASKWLLNAQKVLTFESWSDVENLNEDLIADAPAHISETEDDPTADKQQLDGRQFCYTRDAIGLSSEAQEKLCELVDGQGRRVNRERRTRWRTVADALVDLESSPNARRLFGPATSSEIREHFQNITPR